MIIYHSNDDYVGVRLHKSACGIVPNIRNQLFLKCSQYLETPQELADSRATNQFSRALFGYSGYWPYGYEYDHMIIILPSCILYTAF